jgi:hypothetical protein
MLLYVEIIHLRINSEQKSEAGKKAIDELFRG